MIGCAHSEKTNLVDLPCYNGWIKEKSGSSIIWQPTHKFWDVLVTQLPKGRTVECWHKMPDGRYILPSFDENGVAYAATFNEVNGKYELVSEKLIVSGY